MKLFMVKKFYSLLALDPEMSYLEILTPGPCKEVKLDESKDDSCVFLLLIMDIFDSVLCSKLPPWDK